MHPWPLIIDCNSKKKLFHSIALMQMCIPKSLPAVLADCQKQLTSAKLMTSQMVICAPSCILSSLRVKPQEHHYVYTASDLNTAAT